MLIDEINGIFYRFYLFRFQCFPVMPIRLENLFLDLVIPNTFAISLDDLVGTVFSTLPKKE
jgi:hypothetical protein